MNDLQQHVDVWYALYILQVAYTSFSFQRMRNNFLRNFFFFFFFQEWLKDSVQRNLLT